MAGYIGRRLVLNRLPALSEIFDFLWIIVAAGAIGEYISALSNSATICNKEKAYIL